MIELFNDAGIDRARVTGRMVGSILAALRQRVGVGTNLLQIDAWTKAMITDLGATSCYVDYAPSFGSGPFGHYICTSVNDAVLHGLPRDQVLADGDVLTLDLAILHDGVAADSAVTFVVGEARDAEDLRLIATTEEALAAAISTAGPGVKLGDVSHAIQGVLEDAGYSVNGDFGGHGIGSTMHQEPHVANVGRPGRGYALRPGLLVALEPWAMKDTDVLAVDPDGWTLRSETGARTAHSEHTVAILADGVEIMTLPDADLVERLSGLLR